MLYNFVSCPQTSFPVLLLPVPNFWYFYNEICNNSLTKILISPSQLSGISPNTTKWIFMTLDTGVSTEMITYFICEHNMLTITNNLHKGLHVFLDLYSIVSKYNIAGERNISKESGTESQIYILST